MSSASSRDVGEPQVAYRETIPPKPSSSEGSSRQARGGQDQYVHVWLRLEPLPAGQGYEFVDAPPTTSAGRARPGRRARRAEQIASGVIAGYPSSTSVTLLDGSHHATTRRDRRSGRGRRRRFKEGARKARPMLLEPIMNVEVVTPQGYLGDISGDLSRRRGVLQSIEDAPAGKIVRARVPLAGDVRLCDGVALDDPGPRHVYDGVLAVRRSACERQPACHQGSRRVVGPTSIRRNLGRGNSRVQRKIRSNEAARERGDDWAR